MKQFLLATTLIFASFIFQTSAIGSLSQAHKLTVCNTCSNTDTDKARKILLWSDQIKTEITVIYKIYDQKTLIASHIDIHKTETTTTKYYDGTTNETPREETHKKSFFNRETKQHSMILHDSNMVHLEFSKYKHNKDIHKVPATITREEGGIKVKSINIAYKDIRNIPDISKELPREPKGGDADGFNMKTEDFVCKAKGQNIECKMSLFVELITTS